LKEAAGVCGGRGQLWDLNRLLVGSCCIAKSAKSSLLMLIDILLTLAGRQQEIHSERDPKLAAARQHRQVRRQQGA